MIITLAFIVFMFLNVLMMFRNNAVFNERIHMNALIFSQNDYMTYLAIKHTVSYDYMMWHFWVWPVSKLWPGELQELRNQR
jgi:hypothetical protein